MVPTRGRARSWSCPFRSASGVVRCIRPHARRPRIGRRRLPWTRSKPEQPGIVEQLAAARTAQKRLFAELVALRARYLDAHRAYCAAYAAIRTQGVRERVLTDLDCPPLDPRFDPFLRDAFIGRGKPT